MLLELVAVICGSVFAADLRSGRRVTGLLAVRLSVASLLATSLLQGSIAHAGSQEIQRPRPLQAPDATVHLPDVACERTIHGAFSAFEVSGPLSAAPLSIAATSQSAKASAVSNQVPTQTLLGIEKQLGQIRSRYSILFLVNSGLKNYEAKKKEFDKEFDALISQMVSLASSLRADIERGGNIYLTFAKLDEQLKKKDDLLSRLGGMAFAYEILNEARGNADVTRALSESVDQLPELARSALQTGQGSATAGEIRRVMGQVGQSLNVIQGNERTWAQLLISDVEDKIQRLWLAQSSVIRLTATVSNKYADIPTDHSLDGLYDGLEIYGQSRGDITREPRNEIVLIKTLFGYRLRAVRDEFSKETRRKSAFSRANVALMDPDIVLKGRARGQFLRNSKQETFAILGFFPNSDVAIQTMPGPGKKPKILTWKLSRVLQMDPIPVSNISRVALIGDEVIVSTDRELRKGVELQVHQNRAQGLNRLNQTLAPVIATGAVMFSPFTLLVAGATSGILHDNDVAGGLVAVSVLSGAVLGAIAHINVSDFLEGRTSIDRVGNNSVLTPGRVDEWTDSDAGGLRRRSEVWMSARSLNVAEKKALGISDGNWLVSPDGEKVELLYRQGINTQGYDVWKH